MAVTHVAGTRIGLNGRWMQRCAWCGAKLVDVRCDGYPGDGAFFRPGSLVRERAGRFRGRGFMEAGRRVPPDLCEALGLAED